MRTRMHSFPALLGIALAGAWTVACGSGSDSIASPSGDSGRGATIQGTVNAGAGASSSALGFGAALSSSAVRVSVIGSSQSTTTDSQGRFTLAGLPAGNVTLRFQAAGVDARLTLGGLAEGQVLTIEVHVSGSDARLISDRDDHEFTGRVESVTPPTLVVSRMIVVTNDGTEVKRGNLRIALADIQLGETAKVEGDKLADGSMLAREIKLSDGDEEDDGDNDDEDDEEEDDDDKDDDDEDEDDDDNSGSGS